MIENEHIEFKSRVTDEIYKEVIAFINSDGGTIFVGMDDSGNAVGIDNIDNEYVALTNGIRDSIEPDATMFIRYSLGNNDVIKIDISEGTYKPYYLKSKGIKPSGVYVRQGASKAQASFEQIRQMIRNSDGTSFETERCLEQDLTFDYAVSIFLENGLEFNESKYPVLGLKNLKTNTFTNLGYLFSDQCEYTVKVAVFADEDNTVFSDSREFTGSVLKQFNDVFDYLSLINRTKAIITGKKRIESKDYPVEAVREALLNAIVHRDYSFSGSIIINVNDSKMDVVSLGGLADELTKEDILNGISQSRNPKLADIFHRLKYVESYGTGLRRIMSLYKGNKTPEISVAEKSFRITLPNMNSVSNSDISSINGKKAEILVCLRNNSDANDEYIQQSVGLGKTRTYALLKELESEGKIKITGRGKGKKYLVL